MKILEGKRYFFKLDVRKNFLTFVAVDKKTKRYSHINNLNTVLSELKVDLKQSRFDESTWRVSSNEKKRFVKRFTDMIRSPFLNYFEQQLDIDRQCGEWENRET